MGPQNYGPIKHVFYADKSPRMGSNVRNKKGKIEHGRIARVRERTKERIALKWSGGHLLVNRSTTGEGTRELGERASGIPHRSRSGKSV